MFTRSDELLTVKINPELKDWDIIAQLTDWNWKAIKIVVSNNKRTEEIVQTGYFSKYLENFVTSDKQGFIISDFNIIERVKYEIDDEEEWKQVSSISSTIRLAVKPKIYPPPESYQYFNFFVKIK
jgi:hypothetical protein